MKLVQNFCVVASKWRNANFMLINFYKLSFNPLKVNLKIQTLLWYIARGGAKERILYSILLRDHTYMYMLHVRIRLYHFSMPHIIVQIRTFIWDVLAKVMGGS